MAWNDNLSGRALEIASSNAQILRVVAGPGTGKTFALMRRIARLLEQGFDPRRILLVTFTRVAAQDIDKELSSLNMPASNLMRKGTLHSYCFAILRQANVLEITGRIPRPLLGFEERFMLEDLGLHDFGNISDRRKKLKAFEGAWARRQYEEPGWPQDYSDRLFQAYLEEWLRFHGAMLLGELMPLALKYLRDNPGCLERSQFDHVLVDEYQDLNRAEQGLVDLLGERGTLTVIGDEDQSIYEAFRFAHPEGISRFHETHNGTFDIHLVECRRCPTRVVIIATELIRRNLRRIGHDVHPKPDNCTGDIHIVQWPSMEAEAEGIAKFIHHKIETGEFDPGKILVLCPRRQFGYMIRDALRNLGRSAHSFFHEEALDGNPKITANCCAQEAFTLLTLLVNPYDQVALRCWLGFGSQNLRKNEYQRFRVYCSNNPASHREVLDAVISGNIKINRIVGIIDRYKQLIQQIEGLKTLSGREILNKLFPPNMEWAEPFRAIIKESEDEITLEKILNNLIINITQPELPSNVNYIRIMSLHKSKGLNADHVFVTGCIEGLIPKRNNDLPFEEQMRDIEEQRRLFYVAITRPKKTLVLSSVLSLPRDIAYKIGADIKGGDRYNAVTIASSFIAELGSQCPRPFIGTEWRY